MGEYTKQLLQQVSHWFELADRRFDSYDYPLWRRPLSAAIFTANHGVERSYDRSISKYEDLLIGHLLNAAKIWYCDRYGEENLQPEDDSIAGIVQFKNIPIGLLIPLVSRQVTDDDQHKCVTFLTTITEDEKPTSFLLKNVPLKTLSAAAQQAFENQIRLVVSSTRKICTSARIVDIADGERREMCHSVVERLNIGASLLLQNSSRTRALSIWEFFFVIELLLKTYIFQKGECPKNVHSLNDLAKTARSLGLKSPLIRLSDLPSSGHAIQHRYAQRGATMTEAIRIYGAALSVGTELISEITLCIQGENFGVTLNNKPGWKFPAI